MSVKTTLNIHREIRDLIENASKETGKSRSEFIVSLLMKVMKHETRRAAPSGPVKYQENDCAENWKKTHITLKEDEYEYFTDLRNILKRSVSSILALAVKKYLHELIYGKNRDNYQYQNYFIAKESVNDIICWKIYWGYPKKL